MSKYIILKIKFLFCESHPEVIFCLLFKFFIKFLLNAVVINFVFSLILFIISKIVSFGSKFFSFLCFFFNLFSLDKLNLFLNLLFNLVVYDFFISEIELSYSFTVFVFFKPSYYIQLLFKHFFRIYFDFMSTLFSNINFLFFS